MKFQPPRGMKDIYPEEMVLREFACGKIRGILKSYGFRFVEPSALENFETLAAKAGKEIENEIYCFSDKAGRKLGLRFDLTIGIARMVASTKMARPIKLACISNMWRYDRPQSGRYRSFWQWDAEIFGAKGVEADAEIISIACDIFESFKLDYTVRINSRKLVEGFLESFGVKEKSMPAALRSIDKITKLQRNEVVEELKGCGISRKQAGQILELCSRRGGPEILEGINPENKLMKEGLDELKNLFALLKSYGVSRCALDFSIVRGIDYYTGIVYEVWLDSPTAAAGGGRFDNLAGLYGEPMPATGIAGGLERLMLSIKEQRLDAVPKLLVAYADTGLFTKAVEIAQSLRKITSVDVDLMARSLRKQLDYANAKKIKYVIIIGQRELDAGCAKLRNMRSGEEKDVALDRMEEEVRLLG